MCRLTALVSAALAQGAFQENPRGIHVVPRIERTARSHAGAPPFRVRQGRGDEREIAYAAMDQLQPFRGEALRRGIPADEVERWIGTARPGMTMVPGPGPGSRIAGQLGGHPLLPENISHPELSFA